MLGELSPWHLLILAAVVLVLFGAKKAARQRPRARPFHAYLQGGDARAPRAARRPTTASPAQPVQDQAAQTQARPAAAACLRRLPVKDDGTLVNGVPLSEAQRTNQPG